MNLQKAKNYAILAGVSTRAIHLRLANGTLQYVENTNVIDADKFPPKKMKAGAKVGMQNAKKQK